ncbi:hypothetical protein F5882DRAFT_438266 [Hyaloscypha sp. PMI_1271]|nr:hypothetical protein F5882DRAFT_438266 [Hyaloscypha sp. PMI_1271]
MRKSALLSLLSGAFGELQSLASRAISQNCTGSFTHISAAAAFAALDPGGADDFNRPANTWNDPVTLDVWFNAATRITNTLADSTTDPQATSKITSASIFHKVGEVVYPQSITYLMDDNTLTSVKTSAGTALNSSQYSMPGGTLALSGTYLATLYKLDSAPGTEETLTLTFSSGTSLTLQIVQYSTPKMATTTYKIDTSTNLDMPITYAGLPVVAAVKAILADGSSPG